jgi:hypothetical protein
MVKLRSIFEAATTRKVRGFLLNRFESLDLFTAWGHVEELQHGCRVGLLTEEMFVQLHGIHEYLESVFEKKLKDSTQLVKVSYEAFPPTSDETTGYGMQEMYLGPFTKFVASYRHEEDFQFTVTRFQGSSSASGPQYASEAIYFFATFKNVKRSIFSGISSVFDDKSLGKLIEHFQSDLNLDLSSISLNSLTSDSVVIKFRCDWQ